MPIEPVYEDEEAPVSPFENMMQASVFKRLYDKRVLYLRGPLEDTVADTIVAELMSLDDENDKDVTLYINSPGGIVSGMFAIYDVIHLMQSKVNTVCVGMAASAAAFLLATTSRTRQSLERIQKDTDRDYWMSAQQAVDYGAIDEVRTRGGI